MPPVHPRVGGEHLNPVKISAYIDGSSPRGRGTLVRLRHHVLFHRFIPAWAGNTEPIIPDKKPSAVHPRVGGEHLLRNASASRSAGSSPRGRGTPLNISRHIYQSRFIPAWAGNTGLDDYVLHYSTIHPRVGGEHSFPRNLNVSSFGSSPRGRGTPNNNILVHPATRFIPAWAGNTN